MNKHERHTLMTFCLLAIVGFFALLAIASASIRSSQDTNMRTLANTIESSGPLPAKSGVHLVNLNGDSFRARDIRTHTVSGGVAKAGAFDTIHPHGKAERLYYFRLQGKLTAVTQSKQTVLNVNPLVLTIFVIAYWAAFIAIMAVSVKRWHGFKDEIDSVATIIGQMRRREPTQSLLLTPNSRLYPITDELEALDGVLATTNQQAQQRRVRFQLLMENLPQGVLLFNVDQQTTMANHAASEILGRPIATDDHPYIDDIKDYQLAKMIDGCFKSGKNKHAEMVIGATQRPVDVNVVSVGSEAERQVLIILYDLSYVRSLQQAQTDFIGNVSHELKTPVTAIAGFAETLLDGAQDDPETREKFLKIILHESNRLSSLVGDILTLQKGALNAHAENINYTEFMHNLSQPFTKKLNKHDITLNFELPHNLIVTADRRLLTQVFRNLLENAINYNHDGGNVLIRATADGKNITTTVSDNGVGIAKDEQSRIFERFYRVDKARSREHGGTGLGLAIVQEAVTELGGTITIESDLGKGSTFTVVLPIIFT
ncbi:ATP-binding protein [Lacticaseibacillus pabuli]|uniref:histidine kinase n=1 Tax=Lacticaseibacillus pabuli TaxID=3025672 RepID=A0ABY7WP60_9LACO|nr:ATP-binding protein [Lacticaseibacillus sp. KACC 23028]WDF81988.1 ATP-binding protein [Lacticaseibacillus sp. KACC 23028]